MDDSMSSFRSTRRAVLTGSIRWPDLRRSLIQSTDIWLSRLEALMLRSQLSLGREMWVEFHQFCCNFEPTPFAWRTGKRMTVEALDTVFRLQQDYLGIGPPRVDVALDTTTPESPESEGDDAGQDSLGDAVGGLVGDCAHHCA